MDVLDALLIGLGYGLVIGGLIVWTVMRRQVRDLEAGWRAERAQYGVWGVPKVRPWPRPTPPIRPNPRLSNLIYEGGRPAGWAQKMIDAEERAAPVDAGGRPLPPLPEDDVVEPWQKADRPIPLSGQPEPARTHIAHSSSGDFTSQDPRRR
jgi:hypothetical protein